ncbi:MAG: glycosyltransferase [Patescibacteria group bacterium]|nr:glycosyltransferase [Patescibacteria group bacterium]
MKIAIVADWLTDFGGAERVILRLHNLFPDAGIFTSVLNEKNMENFSDAVIHTSFIQKLPKAKKKHQLYITLMPYAFEHFDLSEYDIVISSSHACAKGVITKPATMHVCYCHSPMRYVWDNCHEYIKQYSLPGIIKKLAEWPLHKLRLWDKLTADRVDYFIANSKNTQRRIKKYYKRDSEVIYPMVNTDRFEVSKKKDNYFIAIGRLIPYKRFDLIVKAFNELEIPIKIIGAGSELPKLKKMAKKNIEFLGRTTDERTAELLKRARALIFPQLEDFGIVPLEAMACGKPVIAFKGGGALETVVDGKTGIFFKEQTVESLKEAIGKFIKTEKEFDPTAIRKHAEKFSPSVFDQKIVNFIRSRWKEFNK